jgi:chromosome segregation ATPase
MELMNSEKESETPRTDASLNTHSMINRQKWCDKCGAFVESIYAGNPMFCRCDPKADRIKKLEAEVERLKSDKTHLITQCANLLEKPHFDEREVHCSCVPALRAEVERLDHLLADASETNHKLAAEVERLQTLPESRHKAFLDLLERGEKAQAEVKEIRAALGDDGRRTHKELIQLATKASEWRTWKEKYMDLRNAHIAEGQDPAGTIWEHADKLQKELKASKAENQKLRARLNQVQGCDCDNYLQTYCDKHNPHINP